MNREPVSLQQLRVLTERLVVVDKLSAHGLNDIVEYAASSGTCIGIYLHKQNEIALQRMFLSADCVVQAHEHTEIECFIVYSGRINIVSEHGCKLLKTGDVYNTLPGESHGLEALEDTWMVTATIPASNAYPDGGYSGGG